MVQTLTVDERAKVAPKWGKNTYTISCPIHGILVVETKHPEKCPICGKATNRR